MDKPIHDEWIRNVSANRPDLKKSQLERTRNLMNLHARDCLVEGYEKLIPGLTLPDPDDRHVLAAAIRSHSSIIVTFNLKDFPANALKEFGIEAQHPDVFLTHLLDLSPFVVCAAIRRLRLGLRNPPIEQEQYLEILKGLSLVNTVKNLAENIDLI